MIEVFSMEAKALGAEKNIRVYLPVGYVESEERYPVLYMHDGKNVFYDEEAIGGVSLSLADFLDSEEVALIVVGIDASEEPDGRANEYCPWNGGEYSRIVTETAPAQGGRGKAYIRYIVEELKPLIDQQYRTLSKDTAIGGISLGGLISTYAVCEYPHIFKKAAAISSGYWRNQEMMEELIANADLRMVELFYMDWGTDEGNGNDLVSRCFVESNESIAELIRERFPQSHISIIEDGEHNYSCFKQRIPEIFDYLYNLNKVRG